MVYEVSTPVGIRVWKVHDFSLGNRDKSHFYNQWMNEYKNHHMIDPKSLLKILPTPALL
jgi:hypothetical protein